MYSLEMEISIQQNDANKTDGKHWSHKHKTRKTQKQEIMLQAHGKKPEKPLEKFTLHVTRYCPAKNFVDYDNMVFSFKSIPDGLKNAGIIKNDSWKFITRDNYFPNQVVSEEMKIKIKVEEREN